MPHPAFDEITWQGMQGLPSRQYTCGHCNSVIASERGWTGMHPGSTQPIGYIYICHQCTRPTLFDRNGEQTPGAVLGDVVSDIPDQSVLDLYEEARRSSGARSYTAAILCCRKLLMHVAVAKGAEEGKSFVSYVEYLASKNYVPPDAKEWVDQIRARGNEANHQIAIMKREDAEELIAFSGMLLKIIYQFPAAVKKRTTPPSTIP